jgi:hypothetical protein
MPCSQYWPWLTEIICYGKELLQHTVSQKRLKIFVPSVPCFCCVRGDCVKTCSSCSTTVERSGPHLIWCITQNSLRETHRMGWSEGWGRRHFRTRPCRVCRFVSDLNIQNPSSQNVCFIYSFAASWRSRGEESVFRRMGLIAVTFNAYFSACLS